MGFPSTCMSVIARAFLSDPRPQSLGLRFRMDARDDELVRVLNAGLGGR